MSDYTQMLLQITGLVTVLVTLVVSPFVAYLQKEVATARKEIKAMRADFEEREKTLRDEFMEREKARDYKDIKLAVGVQEYREFAERVFRTLDKFHYLVLEMVRLIRKGEEVPEEMLKNIAEIPKVEDIKSGAQGNE